MEILRYKKNIWGQEIISGVSWDLIWVFIGAAILFIVCHMIYLWLSKERGH